MNTNQKLEIFRKLYCLGQSDIEKMFEGSGIKGHMVSKYQDKRDKHGFYGNFAFLFDLDLENAQEVFKRIGL